MWDGLETYVGCAAMLILAVGVIIGLTVAVIITG